MQTNTYDIAVIGGGIIGTTCALMLQQAGQKVLLLESDDIGAGASSGNAAHLATEQIFPMASLDILTQLPKMLIDPTGPLSIDWRYLPQITPWMLRLIANMHPKASRRNSSALQALNSESLTAWKNLLASINCSHLIHEKGSLLVYEKTETETKLLKHKTKLIARGIPVEHIDASMLQEQVPALSSKLRGALSFPATGHVTDPLTLVQAMFNSAKALGMGYQKNKVIDARTTEEGVTLTTTDGELHCRRVLIANGAHAKPLVKALTGVSVPLESERGYHLMLPHEKNILPVAITSAERRFIMTPLTGGLRLAGMVEFADIEKKADMRRAYILEQHAQALFDRPLDNRESSPWMGRRPSLPDSLPVIDRTGTRGQVLLAFGHQHLGMTQAAITAQLIVQLYNDEKSDIDLEPYRLTRFGAENNLYNP